MNHRQRLRTRARGRRHTTLATWAAGLGGTALATVFGATFAQDATAAAVAPAPPPPAKSHVAPPVPATSAPPTTSTLASAPVPPSPSVIAPPTSTSAPRVIRPPVRPPSTGSRHATSGSSGGS